MKELGIYIHIPFCKQKCYYCDFVSYANKKEKISEYIECLIKEIEIEANKYKNQEYKVTTIYIGGGTPSLIDAFYIEMILKKIEESYKLSEYPEVTIEINPGTINEEKMKKYKEIGINRISIGLQTTKNNLLKQIGRIHTYEEFLDCYKLAEKMNFKNINVDLMLGLPNQTLEDLKDSLDKIIKLKPNHISLYWNTKKNLEKNGYIHYEISNFAKKGFESKHNMNCWYQKEYLGFGVAAHSYINKERHCNTNSIEEYIKNVKSNNLINNRTICEIQNKNDEEKEYMLLGLRKIDGIDIQEFKNKFVDNPIYVFYKELERLSSEGLLEIELNKIKLTKKGLDFANLVWEEFV